MVDTTQAQVSYTDSVIDFKDITYSVAAPNKKDPLFFTSAVT